MILGLLLYGTDGRMVMAEDGTAYTAAANPYYKHPVTGEIEDAGNNEGIGQGMTESVLYPTALIEKAADGKLYATVRYYLAEYISDVAFWTQERGSTDWSGVSFAIMQENLGGEYCTDYRLEIPAEDAIVRSSFFVAPMGREVIFYMDFSDLMEGSGDFVVSVDTGDGSITDGNGSAKNLSAKVPEEKLADRVRASAAAGGEMAGARELIDSADGLVLSDTSLLVPGQTGTVETAGAAGTVESAETTETKETKGTEVTNTTEAEIAAVAEGEKEGTVIPALSWKLVWQCILIVTIPGLLVGGTLMGVLVFLRRREERK